MVYKDIINYELAENVTIEQLIKVSKRIVNEWMENQDGFIKWEIHQNDDGSFTDIVHWNSKEDAKKAELEMANIPNASEWFQCYKTGSINSKHIVLIAKF